MKKFVTVAALAALMALGLPMVGTLCQSDTALEAAPPSAGQNLELQARAWIAQNYRAWSVVSSQVNGNLTAVNVEARFTPDPRVTNAIFQFRVVNTGRSLQLVTPPIRIR